MYVVSLRRYAICPHVLSRQYDIQIVKIRPPVRPMCGERDQKWLRKKLYGTVENWLFAQTTHVVRSKYCLAWWVIFRQ